MIIALFGSDEARIRARLRELRDEADGGGGMIDSNATTLDGRTAKPADILGPAMSVPFFSAKRLVIVENLLERYQPRYEARGGRGSRSLGQLQPLFDGLASGIPETTILVFVGRPFEIDNRTAAVSRTNPVVQALAKLPGASIEECAAPTARTLNAYIEKEAKERGLRFRNGPGKFGPDEAPPAEKTPVALLAALTDGNTLAIASELDKLVLYTGGGDVTLVDVYRACAGERVAGRFDLEEAVLDGDLDRALRTLKLLHHMGEDFSATFFTLTSAYRRLAPIVELVAEDAPTEEIAKAMGRPGQFAGLRDAAIRRAKRLGLSGLRAAYDALVSGDRDSKTGAVERDIALELTVARLCSLVRR